MEFNMTVTEEDQISANILLRKSLRKSETLHLLTLSYKTLIVLILIAPLIVGLVLANETNSSVIYFYIFAEAFLIIVVLVLLPPAIEKHNSKCYQNKLYFTEAYKYIVDSNTIRTETEYRIVETKIKGIDIYAENNGLYLILAHRMLYIFPKKEIGKLANKDEFSKWLNTMKNKLNSP
jgi:uncharacterized membrane protein